MDEREATLNRIRELLGSQRLGVLATVGAAGAHGSLVAFAVADDLRTLLFATSTATRKFANLEQGVPVALVVDDRGGGASDFHAATAVTLYGRARQLEGEELQRYRSVYLATHRYPEHFVSSPSVALLRVEVTRLSAVHSFQHVVDVELQ